MLRKQFVSAVDLTTALYTTPFIKIKKYGLTFRRKKQVFFNIYNQSQILRWIRAMTTNIRKTMSAKFDWLTRGETFIKMIDPFFPMLNAEFKMFGNTHVWYYSEQSVSSGWELYREYGGYYYHTLDCCCWLFSRCVMFNSRNTEYICIYLKERRGSCFLFLSQS